ncbi:MAG: hypothetical protein R3200_15345, partial [Xanthomonadales bacterium]|nr:hypothetical protein [Xanthomonadales bacterium]
YQGLLSREIELAIGEKLATFDVDFATWEQEKARLGQQGLGVDHEQARHILERARERESLHDALPMMAVVHSRHKLRAEVIRERAEALIRQIETHLE